jgi:hypothetical protein
MFQWEVVLRWQSLRRLLHRRGYDILQVARAEVNYEYYSPRACNTAGEHGTQSGFENIR